MVARWLKIQTVLDGTEALREAGRAYLPQHENESDEAYGERKEVATLLNLSKLTLDSWVGRPFSSPVILNPDVPDQIRVLEDDIDLIGNGVQVFARNWMREGLAKGLAHVMIEMPRSGVEDRTLADDREENMRPYWVMVKPEQLFFADAVVVNGEEVLTEVRMVELVSVRDGFAMMQVKQIRQLELYGGQVNVTLWRMNEKEEWLVHDAFIVNIDRIPLVTFYADRDGLMEGTPPLEDVVDLNLAHWQSTSDQRACLTVARFPILTVTGGIDENNKLTIGPKKWLFAPDPAARFDYLEHSGVAIDVGRRDIHDLEGQMADYGSEFLKKRPGRETATARTLDSAEATSSLQDVTMRFMDAMQSALRITAKWLGLPDGGTVDISTDFTPGAADAAGLTVLLEARKLRDVSRRALVLALKSQGILSDEFDPDDDMIELEDEALLMPLGIDPTPPNEAAIGNQEEGDSDTSA
jgi:hypothetical protein